MAQTLTSLLVHVIFSTKNRADLIPPEIEPKLHAYLGGIAKGKGCVALGIGGTANHVHLLVSMSKNLALSDLMEDLKKDSSKWIKTQAAGLGDFYWQEGYGAFSIGQSGVGDLKDYIAGQHERHRSVSFREEFVAFLRKYDVRFDERYVWG